MAAQVLIREKVYDPVLRILHAWIALAILLLILSSLVADWLRFTPEGAALWRIHVWTGYALLPGLVGRAVWAFQGPLHARWTDLWQWRAWLGALRSRRLFVEPEGFGHDPRAAAAYLIFYALVFGMLITGLALAAIEQGRGPLLHWLGHDVTLKHLFSTPHEVMEKFIWGFVILHIAALILHEVRHGVPMAQAMVSGYQYRKEKQ